MPYMIAVSLEMSDEPKERDHLKLILKQSHFPFVELEKVDSRILIISDDFV